MSSALPTTFTPEVQILSIEFADENEALEIHYMEHRNVAPKAYKREVVTVDASLLPGHEVARMLELAAEWVDAGLLHIRMNANI